MADGVDDPHWFRHQVLTRAAACVWWVVMIVFPIGVINLWVQWARQEPTLIGGAIGLVITVVVMIPIAREVPNGRRMGRMLVHGT